MIRLTVTQFILARAYPLRIEPERQTGSHRIGHPRRKRTNSSLTPATTPLTPAREAASELLPQHPRRTQMLAQNTQFSTALTATAVGQARRHIGGYRT